MHFANAKTKFIFDTDLRVNPLEYPLIQGCLIWIDSITNTLIYWRFRVLFLTLNAIKLDTVYKYIIPGIVSPSSGFPFEAMQLVW